MGHTYADCVFHVVFSTKDRREFPIAQMNHLHRYMAGIAKKNGFKLALAGGTGNHVHLLLRLPTDLPIAKAVQSVKGGSSKWFNQEYSSSNFRWQQGFAAFSVSHSQVRTVAAYIAKQEQHHKKRDFAAEFIALLEKHGIRYDKKYVFG